MDGEVWIVGASQGLGLEVAQVYAADGRTVVGFSRRPNPDPEAFSRYLQVDVMDDASIEAAVAGLFMAGHRPRLVIYMASVVYQGAFADQSDAVMRQEIETNLMGFVRLCRAMVRHKPQHLPVKLVATGSTLGYVGCPSLDTYSASKAALISFARSARHELKHHGIAVQILSPPHMTTGGADLVGPQPFTLAWAAARFARAADGADLEKVLGASNRFLIGLGRVAPGLAQWIMDGIGGDALRRGAGNGTAF